MKAGLFIPCYIDQFYPQVGIDTLLLLEKLGVEIESDLLRATPGKFRYGEGDHRDLQPFYTVIQLL